LVSNLYSGKFSISYRSHDITFTAFWMLLLTLISIPARDVLGFNDVIPRAAFGI
jgi:hypothetical protein